MQKLVAKLFKFTKGNHTFNFFESNNSNAQPFFFSQYVNLFPKIICHRFYKYDCQKR